MKNEKVDTLKVSILNDLSSEYFNASYFSKAEFYGQQALTLAQKSNYYRGIFVAYFNLIYANHLDWVKGKVYFDKAVILADKSNSKSVSARIYFEIARYLFNWNQYHPEIYATKALELYTELGDSVQIAETCYRLSEIYASWDKSISQGKPSLALEYLNRSIQIYRKLNMVSGIMQGYMACGNIYKLYFKNKEKTREYLSLGEKEIAKYLIQKPDNPEYRTWYHMSFFQWAMYYYEMEHDFKNAEKLLKKSISIALQIDSVTSNMSLNHGMLSSYYRHIGKLYLDYNHYSEAESCFDKYIRSDKDISSQGFRMLEVEWFYRNKGMLAIAYAYLNRASALADRIKNTWLKWQSLYYLADLYQLMEDNEAGKNLYFECYKLAKQEKHNAGQIASMTDISKLYAKMGKLDSALFYNHRAEQLNISTIKDAILFAWIFNDLGNIYEKKKDYNKALSLYLKVNEIRDKNNWNVTIEIPYGYIATNSCLARVYLELRQYDKAFEFVNKSLNSFQFIQYPEVLRDDYLTLSKIYEIRNLPLKALEFYKKYMSERDNIQSDQIQRKIQLIEIEKVKNQKKHEIESLSLKNQLKETKLKQQKYLIYSTYTVLILVLILAIAIYKNYRQKSKANQLLKINELELLDRNKQLHQLNEEVYAQNEEIKTHRDLLSKQKNKITDSIVYASLIQQALLTNTDILDDNFKDYFIYYKPRDIVSGDFYWFKKLQDFIYIAIADGTGHGVPGAFMSTLGISLLNEVLNRNEIKSPEIILEELREKVLESMKQNKNNNGMDMALCQINPVTGLVRFACANIPIYLFHNNEFITYKADRMPIGYYPKEFQSFTLHQMQLKKGDTLYICTDGYTSQLGGERYLKFSAKRLHDLLMALQKEDFSAHRQQLEENLMLWQGKYEQVDDILMLGIRF